MRKEIKEKIVELENRIKKIEDILKHKDYILCVHNWIEETLSTANLWRCSKCGEIRTKL